MGPRRPYVGEHKRTRWSCGCASGVAVACSGKVLIAAERSLAAVLAGRAELDDADESGGAACESNSGMSCG